MSVRASLLRSAFWLTVILTTSILYLPGAVGGFLCDDFWYLDQAQTISLSQHPWLALRKAHYYYFRPVPSLLWSILYATFALPPLPYHLFPFASICWSWFC